MRLVRSRDYGVELSKLHAMNVFVTSIQLHCNFRLFEFGIRAHEQADATPSSAIIGMCLTPFYWLYNNIQPFFISDPLSIGPCEPLLTSQSNSVH